MRDVATAILKNFQIEPCGKEQNLKITDYNLKRYIDGDVMLKFRPIS